MGVAKGEYSCIISGTGLAPSRSDGLFGTEPRNFGETASKWGLSTVLAPAHPTPQVMRTRGKITID